MERKRRNFSEPKRIAKRAGSARLGCVGFGLPTAFFPRAESRPLFFQGRKGSPVHRKGSLKLLIIVSVISVLIMSTVLWLQRQPRLYVELIDLQISSCIHFVTISGESFIINDILVDDGFRPTLTDRRPGRNELRSELIYPIKMTPRSSFVAILKVIDTGDEEIQRRCYSSQPKSVTISTSHGEYRIPLTPNKMKTVILYR